MSEAIKVGRHMRLQNQQTERHLHKIENVRRANAVPVGYLLVGEVATYLSTSSGSVWNLARDGQLEFRIFGRVRGYRFASLVAYAHQKKQ